MIPVASASGHTAAATSLVQQINQVIVYPLISLLIGLSVLIFVWGCFQYVINAEDAAARQQGRRTIIFGLIGFVVMVSAYAILAIAIRTFFGSGAVPPIP